tara:strand:+ start:81 stop:503 length:423 start_codon:yes stop_codon:yes gene_type:complete
MLNYNQFVLISAELSHLSPEENNTRTNQLELMLRHHGFKPVLMKGVYKGSSEISFFVPIGIFSVGSSITHLDDIVHLEFIAFDRFQQESILVQYSDGHSRLHYPNHVEHIGKVREVTKDVALTKDAYTFYPKLGKYYATI